MSDVTAPAAPRRWNTKIFVAAIVFVSGVVFTIMALRLPFWTRGQPGSGLFPQILGFGWAAIGLVNLVVDIATERRARTRGIAPVAAADSSDRNVQPPRTEPKTVFYMMALIVALAILFEPLGAIVASALFGIASTFVLQKQGRLMTSAIVVISPIILALLIQVLLKQDLPSGLLSFIPFLR